MLVGVVQIYDYASCAAVAGPTTASVNSSKVLSFVLRVLTRTMLREFCARYVRSCMGRLDGRDYLRAWIVETIPAVGKHNF